MAHKSRRVQVLNDGHVQALYDFAVRDPNDEQGLRGDWWDRGMPGLLLRIGKRDLTWCFLRHRRVHGKRHVIWRKLGRWPPVNVKAARTAAAAMTTELAKNPALGSQAVVSFDDALARYLDHLKELATNRGKPARWAKNVEQLARQCLRPQWSGWPLADIGHDPAAVRDWHLKMTKDVGPVSANRAAETLRALYKHAAKLNRTLPPVIPTSGVTFNVEQPKQVGLAFNQFSTWAKMWQAIKSPKRRAFHLFSLLTGCRPNEAASLRWQDIDCRRRVVVFRATKADKDVTVPMTRQIAAALRIVPQPRNGDDLVFPCCRKSSRKDKLLKGHALRHTYRTVAADLGVDEILVRLLMGHSLQGVSQGYIAKAALSGGISMREAQRKISRRIIGLLGNVL